MTGEEHEDGSIRTPALWAERTAKVFSQMLVQWTLQAGTSGRRSRDGIWIILYSFSKHDGVRAGRVLLRTQGETANVDE